MRRINGKWKYPIACFDEGAMEQCKKNCKMDWIDERM